MCGIFGIVARKDADPSISDSEAARLRNLLAHRGPDAAGFCRIRNAILTHRRLAVVDPTPAGRQPMSTPDGRFHLLYNGELYNDAELRRELTARGVMFTSHCDAETVLHAFANWGLESFSRLRGMFAIAVFDAHSNLLTLARDPLGIKPLYFHATDLEIAFASEPAPILALPHGPSKPNLPMVSAYLSTIRTVLANDTLYDGLYALAPGQMAQCDLNGATPSVRLIDYWTPNALRGRRWDIDPRDAAELVRLALEDSVRRHLRADVPTCALLSGGVDSAITTLLASAHHADLQTYCAGAASEDQGDDLHVAERLARTLGVRHAQAHVSRDSFARDWPDLVRRLGSPLSTPNEVAIHAVASRLRDDGCIVTLSGEGADELFAGYDGPIRAAIEALNDPDCESIAAHARAALDAASWITSREKASILTPAAWTAAGADVALHHFYEREFDRCVAESSSSTPSLDAHLLLTRRINLTGLLQRLDTSTMLAGVEGRTPFADVAVATLAQSLPTHLKYASESLTSSSGGAAVGTLPRTKRVLRDAFADVLPQEVLTRPKASFPLPFQDWLPDHADLMRRSTFLRAIVRNEIIEAVADDPTRNWRYAWPMINLALWGEPRWGG